MNNYPSQTLPSVYPYPIVPQYSLHPYYYSYNEYRSSPFFSPMLYTTTTPREQYSLPLKYYDDEKTYFSENHHHHHHHSSHRSHHRQYSNHSKSSRAHNTSR